MAGASISETYDPIETEVHQKALHNIASEMAITLMRTSGSPVVTEAKDFSTCILDAEVEQLAFSGYITFHLSTAILGVEAVLREMGDEPVSPGDAYICNDPHSSGAIHQGDIGVVMPFFYEDKLIGWGYVNEHVLDVGGSAVSGFAPTALDSYAETLAFPATRIVQAGRLEPQWERFIAANVRLPGVVLNDIRSMIAANNAGQRRLTDLLDRTGVERFGEINKINKALSESAVRRIIAALPDGTYVSEDWIEYDARGIEELHEVTCRLIVSGDEMTIEFRGQAQTDSFINGAVPAVTGQTWSALLSQLTFDIPINAGIWRPIHFDLGPEGSIINSVRPAPVSQSHMEAGMKVNKLVTDVLSQACALSGDPQIRGRVAGQSAQNLSFFTAFGIDRRTDAPTIAYPVSQGMGCGGGAQTTADGLETYAAQCMVGCDIPDVEMEETTQPGMFLWRRVAQDTGGAGARRGGPGVSSAFAVVHSEHMTGGAYGSCAFVPPRGVQGGYPGSTGGWELIRKTNVVELLADGRLPDDQNLTGRLVPLPAKCGELVFSYGDVFTVTNGGGAGIGDPLLRAPAVVGKDVADGYVSAEAATDIYGVVLLEAGAVDEERTEARRRSIRAARLGASPTRAVSPRVELESLSLRDGEWFCALCDELLAAAGENWRTRSVIRESDVEDRFKDWHSRVRPRTVDPHIVVREHYCPACASSLGIDVTVAGQPTVVAASVDS